MNPFDYSLCSQTVTLYRKMGADIRRQVHRNVYLSCRVSTPTEPYGKSKEKKFLLIIPGDFPLLPGDRIFAGIGPETVDWQSFLPAAVPELYEVSFAKPCYWDGNLTHWEAGAERRHL